MVSPCSFDVQASKHGDGGGVAEVVARRVPLTNKTRHSSSIPLQTRPTA